MLFPSKARGRFIAALLLYLLWAAALAAMAITTAKRPAARQSRPAAREARAPAPPSTPPRSSAPTPRGD